MSSQPSKSPWPARPPYPTLSTPASASSQTYGPTSNPSSTSSLASDLSTSNDQTSNPFQPYHAPVPSPTVAQNPHFSPFQPFAQNTAGQVQMTQAEQEQLARLEAHLRGLPPATQAASGSAYWDPRSSECVPKPHDLSAVETRKEAAHRYVRENALVSEAATRLMIREMEDVEL